MRVLVPLVGISLIWHHRESVIVHFLLRTFVLVTGPGVCDEEYCTVPVTTTAAQTMK